MSDHQTNELIKKALLLETRQRTEFLDGINDKVLKKKIAALMDNDTELTQFVIKTSAGAQSLKDYKVKDLQSGDKIKQFVIIKLIAKGGMGAVYLAYDEKLKRNVAIKTIRAEYLKSDISKKRFVQEAQILSQINHPNICQIYDYIDNTDGDLLVLELVHGKNLNQIQLSDDQKLDVFIAIASALVAAHDKDVIHRDLKPDNIMISKGFEVKILDFGIAKSKLNSTMPLSNSDNHQPDDNSHSNINLTKTGSFMGTLLYMSPEQASGEHVTKASDMYSLGIIMHEMLTGKMAYQLDDTETVKQQVKNAEIKNKQLIPTQFQKVIAGLTHLDPLHRFNARDLLKKLKVIKDNPNVKKRKQIKIVLGIVFFSLMFLVVFLMYESYKNTQKNALIDDFNASINEITKTKSTIIKLPIHNATNSNKKLNTKVNSLINSINSNVLLSEKDKAMLIGNARYNFGDYENAIIHLESAWTQGNKNPNSAWQLGSAHNKMHWITIKKLNYDRLTGGDNFEKFDQMRQNHFDKSLYYHGYFPDTHADKTTYIKSQELYYHGKSQEALEILDEDDATEKGLYELYDFKGLVYHQLFLQNLAENKLDQSSEYFNQAHQAYDQSIAYARSNIVAYQNLCYLFFEKMTDAIFYSRDHLQSTYTDLLMECKKALVVNPSDGYVLNVLAESSWRLADWNIKHGVPLGTLLTDAIKWNEKSLELGDSSDYLINRAIIYDLIGMSKNESGGNPMPDINKAIEAYKKALNLSPEKISLISGNMLYAKLVESQYRLAHGKPILPLIEEVEELVNKNKSSPHYDAKYESTINGNLSYIYIIGAQIQAEDTETFNQLLDKANKSVQIALDLSQGNMSLNWAMLGESHLARATGQFNHGLDLSNSIDNAQKAIKKAHDLDPNIFWNLLNWAKIEVLLAKIAFREDQEYQQHITKAHQLFETSLVNNQYYARTHYALAQLYLFELNIMIKKPNKTSIKKDNFKDQMQYLLNQSISRLNQSITIDKQFSSSYIAKALLIKLSQSEDLTINNNDETIEDLVQKAKQINPKVDTSLLE